MPRAASLVAFALPLALASTSALAETRAAVRAGGGLPELDVRVDLPAASVAFGPGRVAIGLASGELPAERDVVVEPVALGGGREIVHVRVPSSTREGVAWEALFAGGRDAPLFAGLTGFTGGDPGERTGTGLQIVPGPASSFVLVGDLREDLRICGQDVTLLDPQALYPATLDLRSATVQRLGAEQLAAAVPIEATRRPGPATPSLSRLLVARGSSVPGSRGVELTDGDPATVWSEKRPGVGQGEFVVMAAPLEVPVARFEVVLAPARPGSPVASPRTFYLVTSSETFEVTLPSDGANEPGSAFEIALPKPVETACVALVLGDAFTHGQSHPEVGVAELAAFSTLDGPGVTLDDLARRLSGPEGRVAEQVLARAGSGALAAVERAYDALDARGRALAIDVATTHDRCEEAGPLLSRGLCESEGEAPRKAREKLERCKGASGVLAARLRSAPAAAACVAPTLAILAGADALEPIADALGGVGDADVGARAALRKAFFQALSSAPAGRLAALLGDARRSPAARLEMMRAAGPRVVEAPAEGDRTLGELLVAGAPLRVRYLAVGPTAELARAGDAADVARLSAFIARDADGPVRARAAEDATGVTGAGAALLGAAVDPDPRVREAAFETLVGASVPGKTSVASAALSREGWSFVKVQAIGVLAAALPSADVDAALAGALADPAPRVRGAALVALGKRRASSAHEAVRERLDDRNEDPEVRATAARVLGALCDASSADRLTEIARRLGPGGLPEDEQALAVGALEGLAALHPADLAARLAPLERKDGSPSARAAAERALAAPGMCGRAGPAAPR